jgi:hypothetical protein
MDEKPANSFTISLSNGWVYTTFAIAPEMLGSIKTELVQ